MATPATHAGGRLANTRHARPPISRLRWARITRRMYAASLAPRSARTASRMASSSRPSSATSSSVRWAAASGRTVGWPSAARSGRRRDWRTAGASVVSGARRVRVVMGRAVMGGAPQISRWTGPAAAEMQVWIELSFVPVHLAGAQVADLAGEQGDEAALADAHAAAAGHDDAGVLAGLEDGGGAVDLDLAVGGLEGDQAALAAGPVEEHGGEPLDAQLVGHVGGVPELGGGVEHLGRPADVGGAGAPVGDDGVEVLGTGEVDAALLAGDPVDDPQARVLGAEGGQLRPEQRVVQRPRRVHEHEVGVLAAADQGAHHRHHRGEAAAGGEHEQRPRVLGEHEVALRRGEEQDVARPGAPDQGLGHLAVGGHGDRRVAARRGAERVGPPVAHAVDLDADPRVLAGLVRAPATAGAEVDGRRVGGLGDDGGDHAAQLSRGAQRVHQPEEVLRGARRREDRRDAAQGTDLAHLLRVPRNGPRALQPTHTM